MGSALAERHQLLLMLGFVIVVALAVEGYVAEVSDSTNTNISA
jgi:hypothetical protein